MPRPSLHCILNATEDDEARRAWVAYCNVSLLPSALKTFKWNSDSDRPPLAWGDDTSPQWILLALIPTDQWAVLFLFPSEQIAWVEEHRWQTQWQWLVLLDGLTHPLFQGEQARYWTQTVKDRKWYDVCLTCSRPLFQNFNPFPDWLLIWTYLCVHCYLRYSATPLPLPEPAVWAAASGDKVSTAAVGPLLSLTQWVTYSVALRRQRCSLGPAPSSHLAHLDPTDGLDRLQSTITLPGSLTLPELYWNWITTEPESTATPWLECLSPFIYFALHGAA